MAPDLQKYYEESFYMFSTEGWKFFMEDMEELRKQVQDMRTISDAKELHFRQGQLDILDLILNRKQTCDEVYTQLQGDRDAENL